MLSMDDFHESYTFFNDWSLHDVSFIHKFVYGHPSKTLLIRTKETHFSFEAICQSTEIHMTSNDIQWYIIYSVHNKNDLCDMNLSNFGHLLHT